ncbi:MAG: hypothetical protein IPM52_01805 [Bacteroidetes bacterium]|nr:hypothetical protein [Bacteroidota bacterium]
MKRKILSIAVILLISVAGFIGCKKTDDSGSELLKRETAREAFAEEAFDEASEISDQAYYAALPGLKGGDNDRPRLAPCATITLDTTVMPRVLTIDFGPENCLCNDGKYRRGMIIVTFNGRWRRPGTVVTHTFQNYYVNDNHVQGTKVMTNQGFVNGKMTFSHVNNGSVTFAQSGETLSWQSEKIHTWVEGFGTPNWRDDVFLITGTSNVSHSNGRSVERLIVEPLRREMSCRYFVSGTIQITPSNAPQRLLDFGDGTCDNQATITIGDQVIVITLP